MKIDYIVKSAGILSFAGTAVTMTGSKQWLADLVTHLVPQFTVIQILFLTYLLYTVDYYPGDSSTVGNETAGDRTPTPFTERAFFKSGAFLCTVIALTCNYNLVSSLYSPRAEFTSKTETGTSDGIGVKENTRLYDETQENDVDSLSLIVMNLWSSNPCPESLMNYLHRKESDLLILIEVTPGWEKHLESLHETYNHRVQDVREDNFGLALFSKHPILFSKIHKTDTDGRPLIQCTISAESGKNVEIFAVHPTPPKHPRYFNLRTTYLKTLATMVNPTRPKEIIVAGDFNCPHWSPHFKSLIEDTRLVDTASGFGFLATWPTYIPILLGPIDHCLISREINVVSRKRGPFVWSDHFPLEVSLIIDASENLSTSQNLPMSKKSKTSTQDKSTN